MSDLCCCISHLLALMSQPRCVSQPFASDRTCPYIVACYISSRHRFETENLSYYGATNRWFFPKPLVAHEQALQPFMYPAFVQLRAVHQRMNAHDRRRLYRGVVYKVRLFYPTQSQRVPSSRPPNNPHLCTGAVFTPTADPRV